jgi:hypothetical protein
MTSGCVETLATANLNAVLADPTVVEGKQNGTENVEHIRLFV